MWGSQEYIYCTIRELTVFVFTLLSVFLCPCNILHCLELVFWLFVVILPVFLCPSSILHCSGAGERKNPDPGTAQWIGETSPAAWAHRHQHPETGNVWTVTRREVSPAGSDIAQNTLFLPARDTLTFYVLLDILSCKLTVAIWTQHLYLSEFRVGQNWLSYLRGYSYARLTYCINCCQRDIQ